MEELVRRVSEKAGISEEQARSAVQTVADFLKERVPAPYSGYIDSFMSGGEGQSGGGFGDLAGGLGGMFGGNKE
ncbi:MAG TPA: hypothetical protein VHL50_08130 [Pyrinomonadaceae bacterium]|nr:hypothetical protein [Pyrinomonadaceae bacterium]